MTEKIQNQPLENEDKKNKIKSSMESMFLQRVDGEEKKQIKIGQTADSRLVWVWRR